jgi:hypothetical protein
MHRAARSCVGTAMPRGPTCALAFAIAAFAAPVAADDHTPTVSTVTKPDAELDRTSASAALGDIPCVFGPDLSRVRAEAARKLPALVRRCALPSGTRATAAVLLDRSGRVRAPTVTSELAPAITACVVSTLRSWRFSRRAAATVYITDPWEPVPIAVFIAVP